MNPARSIGPAIIMHVYKGLWIYIVGPTIGCILGGITYISMRYMDQVPSKVTSSFEKKFVNWFSILKGKFFDAFHKVHQTNHSNQPLNLYNNCKHHSPLFLHLLDPMYISFFPFGLSNNQQINLGGQQKQFVLLGKSSKTFVSQNQ